MTPLLWFVYNLFFLIFLQETNLFVSHDKMVDDNTSTIVASSSTSTGRSERIKM
jgi:hypothetical protein